MESCGSFLQRCKKNRPVFLVFQKEVSNLTFLRGDCRYTLGLLGLGRWFDDHGLNRPIGINGHGRIVVAIENRVQFYLLTTMNGAVHSGIRSLRLKRQILQVAQAKKVKGISSHRVGWKRDSPARFEQLRQKWRGNLFILLFTGDCQSSILVSNLGFLGEIETSSYKSNT